MDEKRQYFLKGNDMKQKVTNEDFLQKLQKINPEILPLEEYKGRHNKIKCKCLKHNKIWEVRPAHLFAGQGCPECKKEKLSNFHFMSNDEFLNRLSKINSTAIPQEDYKGTFEKIWCVCSICGTKYQQTPHHILNGEGCPVCRYRKVAEGQTWTNEKFIEELKKIHGDNIIPLVPYERYNKKIKCFCNRCHKEFERTPNDLISGYGCNKCHRSKREILIEKILSENKVEFINHYKFDDCLNDETGAKLIFDFYLPNNNICIEYDGLQHYDIKTYQRVTHIKDEEKLQIEFEKSKHRDEIKTSYCKKNNIPLLRVIQKNYNEELLELTNFLIKHKVIKGSEVIDNGS